MATALHSPLPASCTPTPPPPTPPIAYPVFPRLGPGSGVGTGYASSPHASASVSRNASTSSSRSTTTTSSTSSLVAAPIRPPPIETSTATTSSAQLPSRTGTPERGPGSPAPGFGGGGAGYAHASPSPRGGYHSPVPGGGAVYGGRGFMRNGPRSRQGTLPTIITIPEAVPARAASTPLPIQIRGDGLGGGGGVSGAKGSLSPTTPRPMRHHDPDDDTVPMPRAHGASGSLSRNGEAPPMSPHGESTDGSQMGTGSGRSSPIHSNRWGAGLPSPSDPRDRKGRTLSVGAESKERERRQSVASTRSAAGGRAVRETPRDYVFGEELGRGSYSTVVQAVRASSSTASPTSPRPPRQFAIKIINQVHLVQEKKTKYAMIERDALVRLGTPRSPTATNAKGHRRGLSSSSSGGQTAGTSIAKSRRSTTNLATSTSISSTGGGSVPSLPLAVNAPGMGTGLGSRRESLAADRLSVNSVFSDSSSSTATATAFGSSAPLSPKLSSLAGRRPSRSAEPPEAVPERAEDGSEPSPSKIRSRPPSPVTEEPKEIGSGVEELTPPRQRANQGAEKMTPSMPSSALGFLGSPEAERSRQRAQSTSQTPKSRRPSQAPSERSVRSGKGGAQAHPGVIRLYSTFNDATSLYFVLELASQGELLGFIRKFGSFDLRSARYYAGQLIDTVEFMHERGVIHRDLKPENILLDEDMRIKITDFGSAKLLHKESREKEADVHDEKKRSFVGSADFVSPEVLRNEPAVLASDIWAFGCILYHLLVGKPPFRGATDYLTFQKILKREFEYPEGFDEDARGLLDLVLNLDPDQRPLPAEIKAHPFFAALDFSTLWLLPAPRISTGLSKPVTTLANVEPDSDLWAVFDEDVSDEGFPYDDPEDYEEATVATEDGDRSRPQPQRDHSHRTPPHPRAHTHRNSPLFDHEAAANAVASVDLSGDGGYHDLTPPRPAWMDSPSSGGGGAARNKGRGWSKGSQRTSSSSSTSRAALSGLLETIGIQPFYGSSRTSRTSVRSDDRPGSRGDDKGSGLGSGAGIGEERADASGSAFRARGQQLGQGQGQNAAPRRDRSGEDHDRWSSLLLANERVVFTSPISIRTSSLPAFLAPAPKRRQLVLTDFPRLICVKEESAARAGVSAPTKQAQDQDSVNLSVISAANPSPDGQVMEGRDISRAQKSLVVQNEYVFVVRPSESDGNGAPSAGQEVAGTSAGPGSRAKPGPASGPGGVNRVFDVSEKGSKGFVVQTATQSHVYLADTPELRAQWVRAIKRVGM